MLIRKSRNGKMKVQDMLQDKEIVDVHDSILNIIMRSDMGKAFPEIVSNLVRRHNEGTKTGSAGAGDTPGESGSS
jgi:hypothetical protein